jgi:hypothetical protein
MSSSPTSCCREYNRHEELTLLTYPPNKQKRAAAAEAEAKHEIAPLLNHVGELAIQFDRLFIEQDSVIAITVLASTLLYFT